MSNTPNSNDPAVGMEHMRERWRDVCYRHDGASGRVMIRTDELDTFYIATIFGHLPGDPTGERTARAIVEAHNAEVDKQAETLTANDVLDVLGPILREAATLLDTVAFHRTAEWQCSFARLQEKVRLAGALAGDDLCPPNMGEGCVGTDCHACWRAWAFAGAGAGAGNGGDK